MKNKINEQLFDAALQGQVEDVKELIASGANINILNEAVGEFPIHVAAEKGNVDILDVLIKNGADLDVLTKPGYSAAHLAVFSNNYEALKLLLDNGANKNIKDPDGNTLLWSAVMHYDDEDGDAMIKMLLDTGIDPHIPNSHGVNLLNLLKMPKNENIRHLFE
ncbi:ankyrin repeat domain-containing protein [Fulvivirga sp. 29W222]|uniref:Ankyrin repeat domain-containing protein n=1 Tax=Fulvivirga marina TaxID=2494733 RepID=A0A937FVC2_9BACT|nr:ankyrin repeat domain-containing protein [Fulvivirga marina]MBL6445148.1 ankyrin repeat domain-containing protein [Fulvivirga marina]